MRNRMPFLKAVTLSLSLLPTALGAAEFPTAEEVVVPAPAGPAAVPAKPGEPIRPRGVTPLVAELLRLAEEERQTLLELRAEIARTFQPARRLELQRQIETVKRETERALLRTQVEFARREGRLQVAEELEAALLRMSHPPVVAAPASPAPARQAP